VQVDGIETDFSPKPSRDTGEPLDFAITGEGFFGVRTAQGMRYTRNGQFTVSPQGLLVTAQGDPVLGRGGRTVRVGEDGRVDPRSLDVVRLENPRKEGDSLISGAPAGGAGAGQVRAGALEASGSDAARSMVDMIASLRAFEAGQRVLRTIDDTLAKSATQAGSLS
jgi:flagellar basal-body rod protein FlgG